MPADITPTKQIALLFRTPDELEKFKEECNCEDMFIEKDLLTLIGTFTEEHLHLASGIYNAMVAMDRKKY